jgi:hypothetical protein
MKQVWKNPKRYFKMLLMGANEIQSANGFTLEKDYMSFCPKIFFSYKWIFEQCFSQIVIINVYSCPNTWRF